MLTCSKCLETHEENEVDWSQDYSGFWCEQCEGYASTTQEVSQYVLYLEDAELKKRIVSKPLLTLKKQISPLRYPGGKSKLINYIYHQIRKEKSSCLISPYTGGGSVELSLLEAGVVQELKLNDIDPGVFSLFWVIKYHPDELIHRIKEFHPTHEEFFRQRSIVKSDYVGCTTIECAWALLITNRLAYSGIFYANPLGGRGGTVEQLGSRWNAEQLIKRVHTIHELSDRITISNEDATSFIEEEYWNHDATLFIDPPYVDRGEQLYLHAYKHQDHRNLMELLESFYWEYPGPDVLVYYDSHPMISEGYVLPDIQKVGRNYSI